VSPTGDQLFSVDRLAKSRWRRRSLRSRALVGIANYSEILVGMAMITVGAIEAKTHLSMLLDRVAAGEEVVITKHGKPVARLVSAQVLDTERVSTAYEQLKVLRKGTTLGGLSWRELRARGHRSAALASGTGQRPASSREARAHCRQGYRRSIGSDRGLADRDRSGNDGESLAPNFDDGARRPAYDL